MPRDRSRTTSPVRIIEDSGMEDSAPLRWAAQLLVGGLPGVLICLVIMWMASKPSDQSSGTHIASVVPLLSANGLVDTPAFHRIMYENGGPSRQSPQFREPSASPLPDANPSVTDAKLPSVNLNAPRTSWKYLVASVRAQIDASLSQRRDWESIVLHGSGMNHGNAKLLNRYHGGVRGINQGMAYHFVIGNGIGATDGLIEAGSRWVKALAAGDADAQDRKISVCLVGDFNERAPSKAQMEALHELMDYLAIKLGPLELTPHQSSCLGSKFAEAGAR